MKSHYYIPIFEGNEWSFAYLVLNFTLAKQNCLCIIHFHIIWLIFYNRASREKHEIALLKNYYIDGQNSQLNFNLNNHIMRQKYKSDTMFLIWAVFRPTMEESLYYWRFFFQKVWFFSNLQEKYSKSKLLPITTYSNFKFRIVIWNICFEKKLPLLIHIWTLTTFGKSVTRTPRKTLVVSPWSWKAAFPWS